jgi:Flp pilus assembly protein TadG
MKTTSQKQFRISDFGFRIGKRRTGNKLIHNPQSAIRNRQGAVAVEFAVVAPVLLSLLFGMIQYGRAFEMQNQLQVAAREGARFASLDHTGMLASGQTSNQKLVQEVKNFLATYGLSPNDVTVTVKDHTNPTSDFNLDNPANDLKLFDVKVSVNYSKASLTPVSANSDYALTGKVVFRNGKATISQ